MKLVEVVAKEKHNYGYSAPADEMCDTYLLEVEDHIDEKKIPALLNDALTEYTGFVAGDCQDDTDDNVYFGRDVKDIPEKLLKKYGLKFVKHSTVIVDWDTGDVL